MRGCLLISLIGLFFLQAISQSNPIHKMFDKQKFEKNALYLVVRGTKTKAGLIAKQFNRSDTLMTHIGLGYFYLDTMRVLNIGEEKKEGNYLQSERIYSFTADTSVYLLEIWKIGLSASELKKAILIIGKYRSRNLVFDYEFKLNNGDKYYCSELCTEILSKINSKKFSFVLNSRKIEDVFTKKILNREIIKYYPVDFFLGNKLFKLQFLFNTKFAK